MGTNFDAFENAYIECALWSSHDDDDEYLDYDHAPDDIAPETVARINLECRAFFNAHAPLFAAVSADQAGHDFWLTRNGHGAGFWDGDWPEPAATMLDNASQKAGERYLYAGDNNLLYLG